MLSANEWIMLHRKDLDWRAGNALRLKGLHQAIARYSIVVSKYGMRKLIVEQDLTYTAAQEAEALWTAKLAAAEPELVGCMGRSVATIKLTNGDEVAQVLGYGPDFDYDRACSALAAYLVEKQEQPRRAA